MEHPLAPIVNQLDPDALYRAADLAQLLAMPVKTIGIIAQGAWLPDTRYERVPGSTITRKVWTGKALIDASRTEPPDLDHIRYTPSTLWRLGCACDDCLAWHNADTRDRRRVKSDAAFPKQQRRALLDLIASRQVTTVAEAAEQVGVTHGQVQGLARRDRAFREALDEAAVALCAGLDHCGRARGYSLGCRGTACRRAHWPSTQ